MQSRLTRQISLTFAAISASIGTLNFVNAALFRDVPLLQNLTSAEVWTLFLYSAFFVFSHKVHERWVQGTQAGLFIALSGPIVLTTTYSFFGFWFFILGNTLLYKYGFLKRYVFAKVFLSVLWFAPWLTISVATNEGLAGSFLRSVNYGIFLLSCLVMLYFIFEEEIRELIAANKNKDVELSEQAAEIARLEPLSVLGERVAHVAHSFKNNLSQVGTALYYLEMNETEKASRKMQDFSKAMNERIDNILMVSRAGAEQAPELFDASRLLAGLNQVYLTEPAFLQRAKVEVDASEPTPVFAARWDFLLMAENILKNALEALDAKGGYGNIRVELKDRVFTLSNDGGAMPLCADCRGDCLRCPRYGRPGQTTKTGGSGHGLAQVFATCRRYGWTLRIKTHEEWTSFEIGLPKDAGNGHVTHPV